MSDMTAANINPTPSDGTSETVAGSADPSSSPSEPADDSDTVNGPLSDGEANAPARQYYPMDSLLALHKHYAFEEALKPRKSAHHMLEEMTELVAKEPATWWDPGRARYRKQLLTDLEVTKQLVDWADLDQALLSTQKQIQSVPLNSIDGESFQRMYDANKSARDRAIGSLWGLKKTQEELTKRFERAATLNTYARLSTLHTSLAAAGGGLLWAMCSSTGALSALPVALGLNHLAFKEESIASQAFARAKPIVVSIASTLKEKYWDSGPNSSCASKGSAVSALDGNGSPTASHEAESEVLDEQSEKDGAAEGQVAE